MPTVQERNFAMIFLVSLLLAIHCQPKTSWTGEINDANPEDRSSHPYIQNMAIITPYDHEHYDPSAENPVPIDKKLAKPTKPNKFDPLTQEPAPFIGNQAYMAIRGNNFYTGSSDYIITFSLNISTGALTNRQQTFAQVYSTPAPTPYNFALILQGQLPTNVSTQSVLDIAWVVVNETAYLAATGYITNLGTYIAIYTLDTTTDSTSGQLINKQTISLPQTENIIDFQWVVVNDTAYLAIYGFDSQYSEYYITMYTLNQTIGSSNQTSGVLIYNQKIFLSQFQSINQISWTVANDIAYLGVWGIDSSVSQYFISTYTLNSTNGNLTNQKTTFMPSGNSITQIEWAVLENTSLVDVAYLAVNGYTILSNQPFIDVFTLNTTTGGLVNKQETFLLQQESCNQIEWVVVNNSAYLGIWGFDSFQNNYYLSTFILNPNTGALTNRQKLFTSFGQMINFIAWVVINNKAFLAAPGYNNLQYMAFIALYTFNQTTISLTNVQTTFFSIQTSINQIEWVIAHNTAYLGVSGFNGLQNLFYASVFTLNSNTGLLYNKQTQSATSQETFYQFEWVSL